MRQTSKALRFATTLLIAAGIVLGTGHFSNAVLAATFTVTSGADSGAGTLRAAMSAANATDGPDTITFAIPQTDPSFDAATGRYTINLLTPLPFLIGGATITGPGASVLTIRRSPGVTARDFRIFLTANFRNDIFDNYFISDLTISDGRVPYVAGSEFFLPHGGGILNSANLTLTRVVVSGNTVVYDSTGANGEVVGGGIYNGGTLNLIDSTVSGNSVTGAPRVFGGGIANFGTLNITNSTVSGNSAVWGDSGFIQVAQGGGIYNNGGTVRLTSSTVTNNSASDPPNGTPGAQGGGIANILNSARPGTVNLRNTIVADNSVTAGGTGPDLSGAINTLDFNLIGNTAGATFGGSGAHDIRNQSALLGPLALNGGQTPTHAPQAGSPAIDKGEASFLSADQRGQLRPIDLDDAIYPDAADGTDIGSFEHQSLPGTTVVSPFIISEFRLAGPGGAADEYVEFYNNTDAQLTVAATDGSGGWAVRVRDEGGGACPGAANREFTLFIIPDGTVVPARSHFLAVNSAGYSLGSYAQGDTAGLYGVDVTPSAGCAGDDWGVAVFSSAVMFKGNTRLDSVGSALAPALYREGAGLSAYSAAAGGAPGSQEHAVLRDLSTGRPRDTGDNAADFIVVSQTPSNGARLGAPGPQNSSGPVNRSALIKASLIDPNCGTEGGALANPVPGQSPDGTQGEGDPCVNKARDLNKYPAINSSQGTFYIRRRFHNNTGQSVTRLRFRIVDATTGAAPVGTADLRALSAGDVMVTTTGQQVVQVKGLTLETPPAQPAGGGLNSTLAAGTITPDSPLAPGTSLPVQFRFGVMATGAFRFFVIVEALPGPAVPPAKAPRRPDTNKSLRGSKPK